MSQTPITSEIQPRPQVATRAPDKVARTLVVVATYNEIENLPPLIDEIFRVAPGIDVLVIDDNSPDGTGRWCDQHEDDEGHLRCLHRPGKLGLGSATVAGMQFAVENEYDYLLTMDADFSHPPRYIPDLIAATSENPNVDVTIGSRYVPGGAIEGWPWRRRWMSRGVNWYARCLLGLSAKDCSGAFRCYRIATLRRLDFDTIRSRGYSYLEEILWRLKLAGARFGEIPIVFVDRQRGQTKINFREAFAAVGIIFRLGVRNWLGRRTEVLNQPEVSARAGSS